MDTKVIYSEQGKLKLWAYSKLYLGLSGAVTAVACAPSFVASTALDRYARVHSVFPPPATAGQRQDDKGYVLDKVYVTSIPTAIAWDKRQAESSTASMDVVADDEDEVWQNMEVIEDGDVGKRKKKGNNLA